MNLHLRYMSLVLTTLMITLEPSIFLLFILAGAQLLAMWFSRMVPRLYFLIPTSLGSIMFGFWSVEQEKSDAVRAFSALWSTLIFWPAWVYDDDHPGMSGF